MITKLFIPKLGMTMEKATIAEWRNRHGDRVEKDAPVLVIDTEKVANEIEAPTAGRLVIVAAAGEELPCGAVVGYIAETDEEFDQAKKGVAAGAHSSDPAPAVPETGGVPAQAVSARASVPEGAAGERLKISPLARRMAKDQGIDPRGIAGSGPGGRIVRKDIEAAGIDAQTVRSVAVQVSPPAPAVPVVPAAACTNPAQGGKRAKEMLPLKGIRKVISDHMQQSHTVSAPVSVISEIDMTETIALRDRVNTKVATLGGAGITYTDIFIMVAARALRRTPIMNSSLIGNEILVWDDVNVGFAVSIRMEDGRNALVVPVIHDADRLSLREICTRRKDLMDRARTGGLTVDETAGGTFTITNTGTLGPRWHVQTPIINLPEAAILGTASIVDRPVVVDGVIVIRPIMPVSITFDHRIMDGAPPAEFLNSLHEMLTDPQMMLV